MTTLKGINAGKIVVAWSGNGIGKTIPVSNPAGAHGIYYQIINSDNTLDGGNILAPGTESNSLNFHRPFLSATESGGFCLSTLENKNKKLYVFCYDNTFSKICETDQLTATTNPFY